MNSMIAKKSITLLTVLTLSAFASNAVSAEEYRLSNELGNAAPFENIIASTTEETSEEPTTPSDPTTDDQSNPQTGNGTIVVPVDPGTTPPVEPETTLPPTTVTPIPVDPGTTVPPTISTQTPSVEPETTEPPTTITPTPEPQTKPDTTEPQTKPDTSTEPQAEPTPIEKDNFNPFVSDKGQKIVGTDAGSIIIQNTDGTTQKVAPEVVGAKTNSDGTISIKDAEGKLKRLPNTGEATSLLSVLGLSLLGLVGFLKKKKFI